MFKKKPTASEVDGVQYRRAKTWQIICYACNALVEEPQDPRATAALDEVHERYTRLHRYAEAITFDQTTHDVAQGRRKAQERNTELRARLARRRREVRELRGRVREQAGTRRTRLPWKR